MAKLVRKETVAPVAKIVNVTDYTMKSGKMNNFDRAGSYIQALNDIDAERSIVWVSEIMGNIIAKVER